MATGSLENNMFKLDIANETSYAAKTSEVDFALWHKRLAHANEKTMNLLLNTNKKMDSVTCESCVKGKMSRKPFNEKGKRAHDLLEIIHSDVCSVNIPSYGNAKYFVTFTDDLSRKIFVYPLKAKSEVFSKFMQFKSFVENQTNKRIKIIRTDNGTEYVNKNFESVCNSNGIKHQKSTAYSPQQNGLSERVNRTLMEKVRCLLIESKLNKKW